MDVEFAMLVKALDVRKPQQIKRSAAPAFDPQFPKLVYTNSRLPLSIKVNL